MGMPFGTYNTSYQKELAIVRTRTQWVLLALGVVAIIMLPTLMSGEWLTWATVLAIYSIAVLGLHLLLGLTGLFSMGHAAFMGLGAYTAAVLGTTHGLPAWATLPIAAVVAGLVGSLFTIPALRIKGFYLVMVTMAAQFVIVWAIRNLSWTGGSQGMHAPAIVMFGKPLGDVGFYWLAFAVLAVVVLLVKNIQRTNTGRQLIAVRDNEIAAEVMGVNIFRTKIMVFFLGSACAGIAGWLWAYFMAYVSTEQFHFLVSMKFVAMIVVGGMGSTTGAILGTTAIMVMDKISDAFTDIFGSIFPSAAGQIGPGLSYILYAALVVFFIMYEPRGLYYRLQRIRLWYHLHPFSY